MKNSTVIPRTRTDSENDASTALATPIPVIVTERVVGVLRTLDAIFAKRPSNFVWTMITLAATAVSLAGSVLEEFCVDDATEL